MVHQISRPDVSGFIDKNKTSKGTGYNFEPLGATIYVANAAGSTGSMTGAAGNLATGVNVARIGEKFVLQNAAGAIKEPTIFTVVTNTGAGITFSPGAAVPTASGDKAVGVASSPFASADAMDAFLIANAGYTQARVDKMTVNDKMYATRLALYPGSFK